MQLSKCVNYVNEPASQPIFAIFICIWTYFRHYLNLVILWSVWTEFKLIPYVLCPSALHKADQGS